MSLKKFAFPNFVKENDVQCYNAVSSTSSKCYSLFDSISTLGGFKAGPSMQSPIMRKLCLSSEFSESVVYKMASRKGDYLRQLTNHVA